MIENYFKLQFRIMERYLHDFGFSKYLLIPGIILFYIISYFFILQYPTWGSYLISLLNFQVLFHFSEFRRNDFLRSLFSTIDYHKIRIIENFLGSIGTIIILLFSNHAELCIILMVVCILFVFISTNNFWSRPILTPFYRKPFEFIVGFRKTWLLILLLYTFSILGILFSNENLSLFCMFCICLTSCSYYQNPEDPIIMWNQTRSPTQFLWFKIYRGILQLTLLILPILILQFAFFPEDFFKPVLLWGMGMLIIPFVITLKYAVFPRKINITEGFIMGLCLMFYPLILAIIPYYYYKSIQNLKKLL